MFNESEREVGWVEVYGRSRGAEGRLRGFNLSVSEEEDGAAAFVAQRRNGSRSGWQIQF